MQSSTMQRLKIASLLNIFLLLVAPGTAAAAKSEAAESIVAINWQGQRDATPITGIVVRSDRYNGYVVTPAAFPTGLSKLTVTLPASGAELVAQPIARDRALNLALLKVNGLSLPAVTLSQAEPVPGDVVWSFSAPGTVDVTAVPTIGVTRGDLKGLQAINGQTYLLHSADFTGMSEGAALLNECSELIGVSLNVAGNVQALTSQAVVSFVSQQNISIATTNKTCVSPLQEAKLRADQANLAAAAAKDEALAAQEIAREMAKRVAVNDERNQKLLQESAKAQQTAERAINAAREAQSYADETRIDLEKQAARLAAETDALLRHLQADRLAAEEKFRDTLEAQRRASTEREDFLLAVFAGLFVTLFIALGLILRFGLKPAAIVEPMKARPMPEQEPRVRVAPIQGDGAATNSQYILEGRDEDGIRYLLQFAEHQVKAEVGVVIGRNPAESEFVINHIDVSRQHARVKILGGQMFIEDLGSTNSTLVNDDDIAGKGAVAINSGDRIVFGAVHMILRIKPAREVISK